MSPLPTASPQTATPAPAPRPTLRTAAPTAGRPGLGCSRSPSWCPRSPPGAPRVPQAIQNRSHSFSVCLRAGWGLHCAPEEPQDSVLVLPQLPTAPHGDVGHTGQHFGILTEPQHGPGCKGPQCPSRSTPLLCAPPLVGQEYCCDELLGLSSPSAGPHPLAWGKLRHGRGAHPRAALGGSHRRPHTAHKSPILGLCPRPTFVTFSSKLKMLWGAELGRHSGGQLRIGGA